jgi:hypothetical protein
MGMKEKENKKKRLRWGFRRRSRNRLKRWRRGGGE